MHMVHTGQRTSHYYYYYYYYYYLADTVVRTAVSNSCTGLRSVNTQRYIQPLVRTKFSERNL